MILGVVLDTKPCEPDVPPNCNPPPSKPPHFMAEKSSWILSSHQSLVKVHFTPSLQSNSRKSFVVSYVFERSKLNTESTDSTHWSMPAIEHSMVYLIWLWTLSLFSMPKWSGMVEELFTALLRALCREQNQQKNHPHSALPLHGSIRCNSTKDCKLQPIRWRKAKFRVHFIWELIVFQCSAKH